MNSKKYISLLCLFLSVQVFSQPLSVNFDILEDFYRREQLLGNISQDHSFVSYPLFPNNAFDVENPFSPEGSNSSIHNTNFELFLNPDKEKYLLKILPVSWINQFNSHHPEGINDGSMIPSKGYQTRLSFGAYFKYKFINVTFYPEFVHAANSAYDGFAETRENQELAVLRWAQYYYHTLNYIDQPELFGNGTYNKAFWGQSSIRFIFKPISVGFSNENIWWGPGIRNSLLMTNTAPGFPHFTFNSVKPIKTGIGSFEGQMIMAWLDNSGHPPPNTSVVDHNGNGFYSPKKDEGRYLNGLLLNYQPKWVPGFHMGLIRSFQMYQKDMDDTFGDYLSIFSPFSEENSLPKEGETNNYYKKDQYNSVYMRFVWPESHVEVYGEFGRSSNYWDNRDFIVQMEHSNAFIIGFRKLIAFNNKNDDHFQVGMELTQLAKNQNSIRRGARSWYANALLRHGYTHKGQMLGAGIGPGSNLQTLNITWHRSLKSIGIQLERYVHNNDFHFENIKDIRMHWIDLSASINGTWDYKNILFNFSLKPVFAKNYQWVFDYNEDDYWDASGANDVFNFHGQIGIMYHF